MSRLLDTAAHQTIQEVVELLIAVYESRAATVRHSDAEVQ